MQPHGSLTHFRILLMELLRFSHLSMVTGLHHALTTRDGGLSSGEFSSLNLAFHVGDDEMTVRENRRLLAKEAGFNAHSLVAAQQVHSDAIYVAKASDSGRGDFDWSSAIGNTDALITAERGLPVLILVADCAPILLADPEKRVLAVVHAGWRGALSKIASKAVQEMATSFGSRPEVILAGIGPCLSTENLEIGEEVAADVKPVDAQAVISGWEKPHLDLRGMIQRDLQSVGVIAQNIETLNFCTKTDERFFSHRGQNGKAGRFGIVAWWEAT
jgi:YfiH family protein